MFFEWEDVYDDIKNGASLERISKKYGGIRIYIPKLTAHYKEKILEEFNGYNYDELAYKYNTTRSNVENVIKKDKADKQPKLFDNLDKI